MEAWFLSDAFGDLAKATIGGLAVGLLFGFMANRSQFCLRSATMEFWEGRLGPKVAIWLLTFSAALAGTQILMLNGYLPASQLRQLANAGTLSGAVIGGLMFGCGMILARGCASRLLVLSATGNMRALVTGLLLTVVAQASLTGALSPLREMLSRLWAIGPEVRNMGNFLPGGGGLVIGLALFALGAWLARKQGVGLFKSIAALGVGAAVVFGWYYTAALNSAAFEPVGVESVSFTGPSANTLMALITLPELELGFGTGLVPGVFAGSLFASLAFRDFKLQAFDHQTGMLRYLLGAALMGFGGMLAGGCAVGAGVTGGAVLSLTSWVALLAMWLSAGVTHRILSPRAAAEGALPQAN